MITITLPIGASRDTIIRVVYRQLTTAGLHDLASMAAERLPQAVDAAGVLLALVRLSEDIEIRWQ